MFSFMSKKPDTSEQENNSDLDKKKCVLVTGGSGFIASHLVDKLIEEGYFVINVDKQDYCSYDNTNDLEGSYKYIQANITNIEILRLVFQSYKIKIVFHLAAQTHVDNSFFNSMQFTYDNFVGTHSLLEVCREYMSNGNDFERFVHMSTDEVYGEVKKCDNNEKTEESMLMPTNPYSATKAGAEMLVYAYYKSFKLPYVIIRCNNVYGPRQYPEKVIPAFIYNILNDVKCNIHGNGETERHFLYVSDAVNAIYTVYLKGEIENIYNISAIEESVRIIDLAKILIKKLKFEYSKEIDYTKYLNYVDDRLFNDFRYYINGDKLKDLGWKPLVKFEEGLEKTIKYFENLNLN